MMTNVCDQCPWRTSNHGKRHRHGFYAKANVTRLWNQIRRGGGAQSCHPTDPGHPDHGAKPDSKPRECPGSVILVLREALRMKGKSTSIGDEEVEAYLSSRKRGLTSYGILYWLWGRMQFGGVPVIGGQKLPEVDIDDPDISLHQYLEG